MIGAKKYGALGMKGNTTPEGKGNVTPKGSRHDLNIGGTKQVSPPKPKNGRRR